MLTPPPPRKIHLSTPPLNVICLISGGKDSFYSLLHCMRNGHKVVALANLYPPLLTSPEAARTEPAHGQLGDDSRVLVGEGSGHEDVGVQLGGHGGHPDVSMQLDEDHRHGEATMRLDGDGGHDDLDLNSHMYQTAGHTILPFYSQALSIPLYRAPILGGAVDKGKYYSLPQPSSSEDATDEAEETESLIPLLHRVMEAHPEANALSAGAILSTYQRTRIESVALRLGLTPLAYLWQYPSLPWGEDGERGKPDAMLDHMEEVGLVARIVKVASGGLDEGLLWGDVVKNWTTRRLVKKGVGRFGGSVLGEGGEYETIVFDGPPYLFKGRIFVEEDGRIAVRGQGGENWLWLDQRRTIVDSIEERKGAENQAKLGLLRIKLPSMLDQKFLDLDLPWNSDVEASKKGAKTDGMWLGCLPQLQMVPQEVGSWYLSNLTSPGQSAKEQMEGIVSSLQGILLSEANYHSLTADSVAFTTILLRSMPDFAAVNSAYAKLFTKPNPPARVTIACGDTLPPDVLVMVSFVLDVHPRDVKEGLHVQSRSYWAPANIGPYSQAISVPTQQGKGPDSDSGDPAMIYIAGQIPLIPNSMELFHGELEKSVRQRVQDTESDGEREFSSREMVEEFFSRKLVLSLQHLWRIGTAMKVDWWVGAVTFVVDDWVSEKASLARIAWNHANWRGFEDEVDNSTDEEDPAYDVWYQRQGVGPGRKADVPEEHVLPNYAVLQEESFDIPHWIVEVDALPRECPVEWQALGVRTKNLEQKEENLLGGVLHRQDLLFDGNIFSFYEISNSCSEDDLQRCFQALEASPKGDGEAERRQVTIYTAGRGLQWAPPAQIIPCRSIWGRNEERLAGAVIVRQDVENK